MYRSPSISSIFWDLKESFWGDLEKNTLLAWKRFLEEEAERLGDQYAEGAIVEESLRPGATVAAVARSHGIKTSQTYQWRKL